jgi:hypothetical protein
MGQGFTKSQHISYYTIWSIFGVGLVINLVAIPPRSSPLGFLFPHLTFCLVHNICSQIPFILDLYYRFYPELIYVDLFLSLLDRTRFHVFLTIINLQFYLGASTH